MEDIFKPTRLDSEIAEEAVRRGLVSRWVPRTVHDDNLLAPDLRDKALRAYERLQLGYNGSDSLWLDAAVVALACIAWDDYDHVMRANVGIAKAIVEPIMGNILWGTQTLMDACEGKMVKFDVRLCDHTTHAHCRVHADVVNEFCVNVVWQRTTNDDAEAAVRATLHKTGKTCLVLELHNKQTRRCQAVGDLRSTDWLP